MKLGIIDYMIIILSVAILGVAYVLFIDEDNSIGTLFNSPTYTVSFDLNGADSITANNVVCNNTRDGCVATLPTAKRNNGSIIGFSLNPDDKNALYKENETITLTSDMKLYVISSKNRIIKIDSSDVDFIEKKEVSCQTFNKESECQVELPRFNKKGYQNIGYSTTKNNKTGNSVAAGKDISVAKIEYLMGTSYMLNDESDNLVLYPKYERVGGSYNVQSYGLIHGNYVEYSSSCSINTIKGYLDEIYNHMPFLFTGAKINYVSSAEFNNNWKWLGEEAVKRVWAVTYTGYTDNWIEKVDDHIKPNTIDIKCDADGVYHTLVHEMVHTWDNYYSVKKGDIGPKVISRKNENGGYDIIKPINSMPDIKEIYDKYNTRSACSGKFYCARKISEFVAEMFSHYYDAFMIKKSLLKESDYPADIKKVIEKYICVAKNNYQETGCV